MQTLHYNKSTFSTMEHIKGGGLGMGVPTSSLISEIFLQHTEQTKIINTLIIYYLPQIVFFFYILRT